MKKCKNKKVLSCGKDGYICDSCIDKKKKKAAKKAKFSVGDKVIISEKKREDVRRIIGSKNSSERKVLKGKIVNLDIFYAGDGKYEFNDYGVSLGEIEGCEYIFNFKEKYLTLNK